MTSTIKIGTVQIKDEDYAIQANAVLGIRGTGKTTLAKSIAEQMLDAKIPIVVFDPTGVWRYLKQGAKPGSKGFNVVVAGGVAPDLVLTPATAVDIVRAAIRENISIVIDLYDPKFSKGDWKRIVRDCFRTLMYENKGVRHIFLEEAAEFVPQRILDADVYAEVEKVARMGGNASLGLTLINQRSQEVAKAVLELCENLFLMRQRGSHAIDAIEKWVDKLDPRTKNEVTGNLSGLKTGEVFVLRGSDDRAFRTHTNKLRSFHPDRRHPGKLSVKTGAIVDVAKFVTRLSEQLKDKAAALPENVDELKKRIRQLESVALHKQAQSTFADFPTKKELRERDDEIKRLGRILGGHRREAQLVCNELERARKRLELFQFNPNNEPVAPELGIHAEDPSKKIKLKPTKVLARGNELGAVLKVMAHPEANGLDKGERKVLTVLAQYTEPQYGDGGVTDVQIAVLTGYKETSRYTYLKKLRAKGYAESNGSRHRITDEGMTALGDFERLPEGDELRAHWKRELSGGELEIFDALEKNQAMSEQGLQEFTGYKETSVYTYLKKLRARQLVVTDGDKISRLSPHLFD